jgi:hypothetical protein
MNEGRDLKSFTALTTKKRKAVELRADGRSYKEIAAELNASYNTQFSAHAVEQWFTSGKNPLAPIAQEYTEYLGTQALSEAIALARVYSHEAMGVMRELMQDKRQPGHVRVAAARPGIIPLVKAAYLPPQQPKKPADPELQREYDEISRELDRELNNLS